MIARPKHRQLVGRKVRNGKNYVLLRYATLRNFRQTFKMPNLPISAEFENRVTTKLGVMARYFLA